MEAVPASSGDVKPPGPRSILCDADLHGECLPELILEVCYCSCHPAPLVPNRKGGPQAIGDFEEISPGGVIKNLKDTLERLSGKPVNTFIPIAVPAAIGPEEARAKLRALQVRLERQRSGLPNPPQGKEWVLLPKVAPTQEEELKRMKELWDKVSATFPESTPSEILILAFERTLTLHSEDEVREEENP